jgi:2'-5' RNA ligase
MAGKFNTKRGIWIKVDEVLSRASSELEAKLLETNMRPSTREFVPMTGI